MEEYGVIYSKNGGKTWKNAIEGNKTLVSLREAYAIAHIYKIIGCKYQIWADMFTEERELISESQEAE